MPVHAASESGWIADIAGESLLLYAADVIAAVLAAVVLFLHFRLSGARKRLETAETELDRLRAQAEAEPAEHLAWLSPDAPIVASPGLAALLNGAAAEPDALVEAIAEADRPSVSEALEALRTKQEPFRVTARESEDGRALRLEGRPLGGHGGIVWVSDATDEVAALEAEHREAATHRAVLDMVPLPVWRRDEDLRIAYANPAYARAVEAAPGIAGRRLPELAMGAVPSEGRALAERALRSGTAQAEKHHIVIGGARRLLRLNEQPLGDGLPVAGYAADETELEELRNELARHIEAHHDVLQNLGTAIAIYAGDQRLQFFNNAFVHLWRLDESWLRTEPTMGEVLEMLREQRRLPEYADFPAFKRDQLALFTSLIEPVDELVHLPDGTTFRAVTSPHPFGGLVSTWEDVTDALALERSYNTLTAVQRETLDNLYEGVAVIGDDGRLKLSNPAFAKMWQLADEDLTGETHVSTLVERMRDPLGYPGDWPDQREELLGVLTDREPQSGRLERVDGSVLDFATVPLPDGAVLLSFLDVSDSIRVERALRERNEALETADRLKSEFIANVSYELRTPLNTIIGFAEILTGQYFGELNQRQLEYSQGVLESSQRLLSLINDILDLASIEAGHMALEPESIDVSELLETVTNLIRERARKKRVTVELDCPADIGPIVADERRLKQAFFNILSNSVKFTPEDGNITVSARRANGALSVAFADTGIGMTDDERKRAFGRFERGANPDARRSGAGLGLSLVKSFIELHGGKVELDSQPGSGTRVICRLPAREAEAGDGERIKEVG